MNAITSNRPAAAARPAAQAQQAAAPTREQKLKMDVDRFESTRYQAEERLKSGFGSGVKCVQAAEDAGHKVGRAMGSVVGAGGKDGAPAVIGELAGFLVSAPVCFAGPVANSLVQEGIMFTAEQRIKHAEKQLGH